MNKEDHTTKYRKKYNRVARYPTNSSCLSSWVAVRFYSCCADASGYADDVAFDDIAKCFLINNITTKAELHTTT